MRAQRAEGWARIAQLTTSSLMRYAAAVISLRVTSGTVGATASAGVEEAGEVLLVERVRRRRRCWGAPEVVAAWPAGIERRRRAAVRRKRREGSIGGGWPLMPLPNCSDSQNVNRIS